MPITYSHRLVSKMADVRKSNEIDFLGPDSKSQVTVRYEDDEPVAIDTVVLSTQHLSTVSLDEIESALQELVIKRVIPEDLLHEDTEYHINPTGRFVEGGPKADAGLTGRKIIVDTYGGRGRHGGGAFSGKDPSKVDRSATYQARYIAKNIVAAGLADRCSVQIASRSNQRPSSSRSICCARSTRIPLPTVTSADPSLPGSRPTKPTSSETPFCESHEHPSGRRVTIRAARFVV